MVVKLPVFKALRIKDPLQAEKILAYGHADTVGMYRALIIDPELSKKDLFSAKSPPSRANMQRRDS